MSERRKARSRSTGPVLDQQTVQSIVGPHIDINTVQILDLSRTPVANKLNVAPDTYAPNLQGDLLSVLPNLTSLALRDYNWRSVDLFSGSITLRKLDLRGNHIEASALKRLLTILPGLELLQLSDVPYKTPTELYLALLYSPGPAVNTVSLSLKIRLNTIDRLWSALQNEVTPVRTKASAAVQQLTLDDTCHLVVEEVLVDELKQVMWQRLSDPNKEKEGYKQMYDSLIHERAVKLASGQSARVKGQLLSMSDSDKLSVQVHVSNCSSDCKCHNEGLSLDWLPSELKEALRSAMSVKPMWHVTRMGRANNQISVGVKRPRDDTAQVRVLNTAPKNRPIEHVTPAASANTLAHVVKCRSEIGQRQSTMNKSKALVRTSVVRHYPHSHAKRVPFDQLSPQEKLEAVDQVLKTIKL